MAKDKPIMLSKVFKAYDVRGVYPDPLSEKVAWKIGYAAGRFLRSQLEGSELADPMLQHVVVGRDMRTSSPKLAEALSRGLRAAEMNVFDVGLVDTSFIYFAINHLGCAGGIMTTASHNPSQYNGFKISGRQAKPIGSASGLVDIQRIAATIEDRDSHVEPVGRLEKRDLWADYRAHIHRFLEIRRPLRVAVDASNGMAGVFIPHLFEGVKNLEIIPLNFEADGKFVHDPNPLVPENMAPTQELVREHRTDLGVCFDGDADRCMITDENGSIVGCDLLGALFAEHFLKASPSSAIVYDLRSSKALKEAIEQAGGKPVRGRVGHVFLKKLLRDHDAVFGAELSGHMYYRDNYYTDSGAITFAVALSLVSAADRPLSELIAPFARYAQSGEQNFEVEDKAGTIAAVKESFAGRAEIDELDGVTVDAWEKEGWWFNVRPSNTEPLLRFNMEAKTPDLLAEMQREVTPQLGEPVRGH